MEAVLMSAVSCEVCRRALGTPEMRRTRRCADHALIHPSEAGRALSRLGASKGGLAKALNMLPKTINKARAGLVREFSDEQFVGGLSDEEVMYLWKSGRSASRDAQFNEAAYEATHIRRNHR